MILLKNERKLLKILRHNESDYDRDIFTYDFLEENFYKDDPEALYTAVRSLSEKSPRLVTIATMNDIHFGVTLESTGLHIYEYYFQKIGSHAICYIAGLATPFCFSCVLKFLAWLLSLMP